MKIITILNLTIGLILSTNAIAQLDSLQRELKVATSDSTIVRLMLAIGEQHSNQDSSMMYWKGGLSIVKTMKWKKGEARIYESMGLSHYRATQLDSAIYFWKIAIDLYTADTVQDKSIESRSKLASINYNITIPNFHLGNYLEAIYHTNTALEIYLKLENQSKTIACYNFISLLNFEQDNFIEAKKYAHKSVDLAMEMQDSSSIKVGLNSLAGVYLETLEYKKALEHFKQSILYEDKANLTSIQQSRMNIGQTFIHLKEYDSAQVYLEEGVRFFEKSNDVMSQITAFNILCDLYEAQQEWKKIIPLSKKSLKLMGNLNLLKQKREAHENLYLAYENTGQLELAFENFKAFTIAKDSMVNEKKGKEIEQLRAKLDYEEQQRDIGQLTKENLAHELKIEQDRNLRNQILASSLTILLIGVFFWIAYKRKKERKEYTLNMKRVEIEQRMLRSQMNPHFIFNALNSIQSFITTNDGYAAELFMSKFSMLVRKILENSTHKLIALEEEIDTLRLYLELEKSRFEERFDFEIIEDADTSLSIPPMLLQPFIENAIIHGMKGKTEKGQIIARFIEEEDRLRCEVEDNGVGRAAPTEKKEHNSLATSLTNDRVKFFNEFSRGEAYHLQIIDLKNVDKRPIGTKVVLTIPLVV